MPKRKPAENAAEMQHAPAVQTERERRAALVPHFEGDTLKITHEQRDAMLDAFQTDHGEILRSTLGTAICGNQAVHGEDGDNAMNTALRLLVELRPQNALERMLVAQFVACDRAASQCLGIGFNPENDANGRRKYLNLGVQFQGLLVRQVEALAKLRNGNQQRVTVEHVHVHQGGQAIVGNVTHAPEGGGGAGGER